MLQIFNITAPIFFIIGLGYGAVRFGVFRFEELRGTAKFVMKVGLPALVFFAIAAKPANEVFNAVYLAGYAAATLAAFFIGWLFGRLRGGDSRLAALSGFSMSFSNTGFIGYPLLSMVIGDAAGGYFAMNVLVENMLLIPLFFILADSADGDGGRLKNLAAVLKNLLKNPIILAQFAAVPFAFGWLPLPAALLKTAGVLSAGSGPVALFVIGGSLVGLRLGGRLADIFLLTAGKLLLFSSVTFLVACHLLYPEVGVGLGDDIVTASFVSMPETAVHENASPVLAQYDVRMSRQPRTVHPVTESAPPQIFPDNHLRLGVPAFDGRHVVVPLLP